MDTGINEYLKYIYDLSLMEFNFYFNTKNIYLNFRFGIINEILYKYCGTTKVSVKFQNIFFIYIIYPIKKKIVILYSIIC